MGSFSKEFEDEFLDIANDALGDDLTWVNYKDDDDIIDFSGFYGTSYKGNDMGLVVDIQSHNVECYRSLIPDVKDNDIIINNQTEEQYIVDSIEPKGEGFIILVLRYEGKFNP